MILFPQVPLALKFGHDPAVFVGHPTSKQVVELGGKRLGTADNLLEPG